MGSENGNSDGYNPNRILTCTPILTRDMGRTFNDSEPIFIEPEIDLSAGTLPDDPCLVQPSEKIRATEQTVCVAHSDPSFSDQTWCGQPVGKTKHLSLDNTLYLLTGNISLPEFTNPQPCAECLKIVRSYLAPEPPFYADTGERLAPPKELLECANNPDFLTDLYATLSSELAEVLTVILKAPFAPTSNWQEAFATAFKKLSLRFHCGPGRTEIRLDLDYSEDLAAIFDEIEGLPEAEEMRKHYTKVGQPDPQAAMRVDLAVFSLLNIQSLIERIELNVGAAVEAASAQAVILSRGKMGFKDTNKGQALADCFAKLQQGIKSGIANPVGRPPLDGKALRMDFELTVLRWQGEQPTKDKFAMEWLGLQHLRTPARPNTSAAERRDRDGADSARLGRRLSEYLRVWKNAGIYHKDDSFPTVFRKIRAKVAVREARFIPTN